MYNVQLRFSSISGASAILKELPEDLEAFVLTRKHGLYLVHLKSKDLEALRRFVNEVVYPIIGFVPLNTDNPFPGIPYVITNEAYTEAYMGPYTMTRRVIPGDYVLSDVRLTRKSIMPTSGNKQFDELFHHQRMCGALGLLSLEMWYTTIRHTVTAETRLLVALANEEVLYVMKNYDKSLLRVYGSFNGIKGAISDPESAVVLKTDNSEIRLGDYSYCLQSQELTHDGCTCDVDLEMIKTMMGGV